MAVVHVTTDTFEKEVLQSEIPVLVDFWAPWCGPCKMMSPIIDEVSEEAGKFDFVLADLGVSSMQIDNPDRGFSYKVDAPLDLRLDPEHGVSAAERLNELSTDDFIGMMIDNADEPYAVEIARTVMQWKKKGRPVKTFTIAGNFFDLLKNIKAVADTVKIGMGGFTAFGAPSVLVKNISVAG